MSGDTPTWELLDGFVDALRTLAKDAPSREVEQAYTWVVESYGDDVARLRAEVEKLERVAYDSATGNAWVDIYEGMHAEVERLTADRDETWAERVEEGKAAARAGREAARLRERVAVLEGERDELLAWAEDQPCEMQADDRGGYTPDECSPHHSGRCWPCEAKVRATARDAGTPTGATPSEPGGES